MLDTFTYFHFQLCETGGNRQQRQSESVFTKEALTLMRQQSNETVFLFPPLLCMAILSYCEHSIDH